MIQLDYGVWLITRAEWGARAPRSRSALTGIDLVTSHWEGPHMGSFPHESCAAKVRGIQNYHMDSQGWSDIAYNFLACPHRYVFEGRGRGVRSAANGTTAGNDGAYAGCFLGGEGDPFPEDAKAAMRAGGNWMTRAGSGRNCHRDWKPTTCPGDEICGWVRAGQPIIWDQAPTPIPVPKLGDLMPFPVIGTPLPDQNNRPWTALLPGKIVRFSNVVPLPPSTPDEEWLSGRHYEAGVDSKFLSPVERTDSVDNYDEACLLAQRSVLPNPQQGQWTAQLNEILRLLKDPTGDRIGDLWHREGQTLDGVNHIIQMMHEGEEPVPPA